MESDEDDFFEVDGDGDGDDNPSDNELVDERVEESKTDLLKIEVSKVLDDSRLTLELLLSSFNFSYR